MINVAGRIDAPIERGRQLDRLSCREFVIRLVLDLLPQVGPVTARAIIAWTSGSASQSAAQAPRIAKEVGFEVMWLWIAAAASMRGCGPST